MNHHPLEGVGVGGYMYPRNQCLIIRLYKMFIFVAENVTYNAYFYSLTQLTGSKLKTKGWLFVFSVYNARQ